IEAARSLGVAIVALREPQYPVRLAMIDDGPPIISVRGKVAALARPMIAVVGGRNASAAGVRFAEKLARELRGSGVVIAAGRARRVDAAARRAALAPGSLPALAGAHDHISPPGHGARGDAMLSKGAAISEMPLGWAPRARVSPRRNRLISGLSVGVVVIEA